eukprot:gene11259-3304_t
MAAILSTVSSEARSYHVPYQKVIVLYSSLLSQSLLQNTPYKDNSLR